MTVKITSPIVRAEVVQPGEPSATPPPEQSLWKRPVKLPGNTVKIKPVDGSPAMYVTINQGDDDRIREIFINTNDGAILEWTTALMRTSSALLREGKDPSFLAKEWMQISGPTGFWATDGKFHKSHVAAIGHCILSVIDSSTRTPGVMPPGVMPPGLVGAECPSCKEMALVKKDGCDTCSMCGYSKCG